MKTTEVMREVTALKRDLTEVMYVITLPLLSSERSFIMFKLAITCVYVIIVYYSFDERLLKW